MKNWRPFVFFTITNCQIVRFRSLPHYKFMCLSAYWRYKLTNECARICAVIVKRFFFSSFQIHVRVLFIVYCSLYSHKIKNTAYLMQICAYAQICIGVGRAKWTTVSLNSFTILIIISILVDPFFCCTLLSEKRCHSLFIGLFTDFT